jgi:hypothetical protein
MWVHRVLTAAAAVAVLAAAAACGGGASAAGTTATGSAATGGGSLSVGTGGSGYSFSTQVASVSSLLDRVSKLTGSAGSGQLATAIAAVRRGLTTADTRLTKAHVPSSLQSGKERVMGFIQQWNADLGDAESLAADGHTSAAISKARSSTYTDLQNLVQSIQASGLG